MLCTISTFFTRHLPTYTKWVIRMTIKRRLLEHNESAHNNFTEKHRPWKLCAVFECSELRAEAMSMEQFIKKQKSRKLLEMLCEPDFVPAAKLSQLVRVRD